MELVNQIQSAFTLLAISFSESAFAGLALVAIVGIVLLGGVFLTIQSAQRQADIMRRTYEIRFHGPISHKQELAFIRALTSLPSPKPLQPVYAVSFERYGTETGERFFLHTPGRISTGIDELIGELLNASLEEIADDDDPVAKTKWEAGLELSMNGGPGQQLKTLWNGGSSQHLLKSLRILDVEGTAGSMSAKFKSLPTGTANVLQIQIFPDRPRGAAEGDKDKVADHTFAVQIRAGAVGEYAEGMVKDLWSVFKSVEAPGAKFNRRLVPHVCERINDRAATYNFPMILSATELSAFLWPLNGVGSKRSKRLAPTPMHDADGIVIGTSDILKLDKRQVAIPEKALTVHTWVLGPSGTGKSTLLHNLATQVIDGNMGLVLLDPKGDLCRDVLESLPLHREKDLIWFNPLDTDFPIGLNVLAGNDPERTTSHIVGMFKNLSKDTWSAQLQRVLRLGVFTAALNGLTLYDVRLLLSSTDYRNEQVRKLDRKRWPDLYTEWKWLDGKADLTVDSAVNRLDNFLGSRVIRNIVSQKDGLDFDEIVRARKILLVPLPDAQLGETNAAALGQLIFNMVWDATLRRPPEHREPNVLMADELQMFAEIFDTTKADPFALARSYGLGLIVANQYQDQLPKAVQQTLSKNAQSQIAFRLASDDAKSMQSTYGPLTADDLANLPRFTVAAKLMSSQGNAPVVTLKTPTPPKATGAARHAVKYSREKYGRPVMEVEADLLSRHKAPEQKRRPQIGRIQEPESE